MLGNYNKMVNMEVKINKLLGTTYRCEWCTPFAPQHQRHMSRIMRFYMKMHARLVAYVPFNFPGNEHLRLLGAEWFALPRALNTDE